VARDTTVDALVRELERALASLRAAQRMAAELQRRPVGRPPRIQTGEAARVSTDLRYSGMTVAEAAGTLGISEEYVRRLLRSGRLVGVPFGGQTGWRLPRDYVLRLQAEIATAEEGKDAARRRLVTGSPRKRASSAKDRSRTTR
jgi:excisionase family DNA binding protein